MEYAILSGRKVVNVIVADADFVSQHEPGAIRIDNLNPIPGINWTWNGASFAAPLTISAPPIAGTQGIAITPVRATAFGGSGSGFSFAAAELPSGLSISDEGQISGTPETARQSPYMITVTDSAGSSATATGILFID